MYSNKLRTLFCRNKEGGKILKRVPPSKETAAFCPERDSLGFVFTVVGLHPLVSPPLGTTHAQVVVVAESEKASFLKTERVLSGSSVPPQCGSSPQETSPSRESSPEIRFPFDFVCAQGQSQRWVNPGYSLGS